MFHSLVRPVALYGAETWTLLPSLEHIVDTQDMTWVRQIAGVTLYDELTNAEVRRRAHCPVPLSEACRQARLRYFGHLSRLADGRAPKAALQHPPPGQQRPGRPRMQWSQLISVDAQTRSLTCDDLRRLAPDREAYRNRVVYAWSNEGQPSVSHPEGGQL